MMEKIGSTYKINFTPQHPIESVSKKLAGQFNKFVLILIVLYLSFSYLLNDYRFSTIVVSKRNQQKNLTRMKVKHQQSDYIVYPSPYKNLSEISLQPSYSDMYVFLSNFLYKYFLKCYILSICLIFFYF